MAGGVPRSMQISSALSSIDAADGKKIQDSRCTMILHFIGTNTN